MAEKIFLGCIVLCVLATTIASLLTLLSGYKARKNVEENNAELEPLRQQIKDFFANQEQQLPLVCGSCGEKIINGIAMQHKPWCKYMPSRIRPIEENRWP